MDTTNIILHCIADFRDQVNKTEAKCSRPRPSLRPKFCTRSRPVWKAVVDVFA